MRSVPGAATRLNRNTAEMGALLLPRRAKTSRPGSKNSPRAALGMKIPAMTDFRARGTIMGLAGLTAVFGMGTGVTPPVWSPEKRLAGG